MTSTQSADELRHILTVYCLSLGTKCPDIEKLKTLLSKVSDGQIYDFLSSIKGDVEDMPTVLTLAARMGHTGLCVTLLSSSPPADRLKLILVNKCTTLYGAAYEGHTETVSGILNCLTTHRKISVQIRIIMIPHKVTSIMLP